MKSQEVEHRPVSKPNLDDDCLISNGLEGDQEAFNILFSRYRPLLYRLAYRIIHNHEEAEDAVQNCSLLAYCKLEAFKHEGAFRNWLARILVNEAIAILRKRKGQRENPSPQSATEEHEDMAERIIDPGPDPETILAEKQKMKALARKMSKLCALQRSALLLCGVWEYTAEEASAVLKVSPGTVRSRLFRARRQLALLSA